MPDFAELKAKGKIENSAGFVKRDFLMGSEFHSFSDLNPSQLASSDQFDRPRHNQQNTSRATC